MANYSFHKETPVVDMNQQPMVTMPMAYGGEVEPRKMQRGGEPVETQVRNSVKQNLANIPTGNATREQLRELAEEIFREQGFMNEGERGIYGRGGFDPVGARELRAQEIENILDRLLENRSDRDWETKNFFS